MADRAASAQTAVRESNQSGTGPPTRGRIKPSGSWQTTVKTYSVKPGAPGAVNTGLDEAVGKA
jgi:hypothetical protein